MADITYEMVKADLDSAMENGYDQIISWSAEDIAYDLIAYAEDCWDHTVDELVPHINKWLEERKTNG